MTSILDQFKLVVRTLEEKGTRYAAAGGLAASAYRVEPRATKDIDILIMTDEKPEQLQIKFEGQFKMPFTLVRRAQLEGGPHFAIKRASTPVCILVGRNKDDPLQVGVDFLLPNLPWFHSAFERAQTNLIDFGFGKIPTLTPEDLILAKIYSSSNNSQRFKDIDDIQHILIHRECDIAYIASEMERLGLILPRAYLDSAPKPLQKASRRSLNKLRGR